MAFGSSVAPFPRANSLPRKRRGARSWFRVDFVGEASGAKVHTRVRGADPGYSETAKMLSEAAMCLAFDDNPTTAGQVTTAAAMGENLLLRLADAGIDFAVVDRRGACSSTYAAEPWVTGGAESSRPMPATAYASPMVPTRCTSA